MFVKVMLLKPRVERVGVNGLALQLIGGGGKESQKVSSDAATVTTLLVAVGSKCLRKVNKRSKPTGCNLHTKKFLL